MKFTSKTKFNYRRGIPSDISGGDAANLALSLFSRPSTLKRTGFFPPFPAAPPVREEVFNNKMVGIFCPSTLSTDQLFIDGIKYYWNTNPAFERFLILEYDGTTPGLLATLDKAYALGKRYIIGFTTSTALIGALDWLNKHPDVQGVTEVATSGALEIPKRVYRVFPDAVYELKLTNNYIFQGVPGNGAIYYIYNSNQAISLSYKTLLTTYCQQYGVPLHFYQYTSLAQLNYANMQVTMQQIYDDMVANSYTKSTICISMVDYDDAFYALFDSGMANVGSLGATFFDFKTNSSNIIPSSTENAKTYFDNLSFIAERNSLLPSKILYDAADKPGLRGISILYQLENYGGYVNELGIYGSSYQLDPITRDNVAFHTMLYSKYVKSTNQFIPIKSIFGDENGNLFEYSFAGPM